MDDSYQPQIGALLRMAWETLQADLYAGLLSAGFDDLRDIHRPLLRYPPIDGMRPSQLAAHLRLSKQATNDLLRDLEDFGYVTLEHDPTDGRARIIRYTDRGWLFFRTGSNLSRAVGERWAAAVGRERVEQLQEILREICALPDEPDAAVG